jgi:acetolactate synthase regulatory subunit
MVWAKRTLEVMRGVMRTLGGGVCWTVMVTEAEAERVSLETTTVKMYVPVDARLRQIYSLVRCSEQSVTRLWLSQESHVKSSSTSYGSIT